MKNVFLIAILILLAHTSFCQTDGKKMLTEFFKVYKKSPAQAVNMIYNTSNWINNESESVKSLKAKLAEDIKLLGEYIGEEYIYHSGVGSSYVNYIYLVKYERQPLRFTFELYKPKDKWVIYSFKYDDSFDEDLEEVMKNEYLKKQ